MKGVAPGGRAPGLPTPEGRYGNQAFKLLIGDSNRCQDKEAAGTVRGNPTRADKTTATACELLQEAGTSPQNWSDHARGTPRAIHGTTRVRTGAWKTYRP